MNGKVALITGASMGIGRATALAFANAGASIAAIDINESEGEDIASKIVAAGGACIYVKADVSQAAEMENAVAVTVAQYKRLDYAANDAGIDIESLVESDHRTATLSEEMFDKVLAVNLKGIFLSMKYEIRQMLKQGRGGSIVNVASVAAL